MSIENGNNYLTFALPKGALFSSTISILEKTGFNCQELKEDSRKMYFINDDDRTKYIICRPTDIPTYVEYGAADLGLVGKDTIIEQKKDIYELLDLKYGCCRFAVAVPQGPLTDTWSGLNRVRVATKFPKVAEDFFNSRGKQMDIIKLHGNIELAPMVGLAEMIVDIVSTGKTLRENNLVEVAEIMKCSARLVANRVSNRVQNERINQIVERMRKVVAEGEV